MCAPPTDGVHPDPHPAHTHLVSRRRFFQAGGLAALGVAASAALPTRALAGVNPRTKLLDLTHVFRDGFPVFPGLTPPKRQSYPVAAAMNGYLQQWSFQEHCGTHLDAPGHFASGGRLVPQLRLDELVLPAVVIDVSARAATDPDTEVGVEDLEAFETSYGRIPEGAAVLMRSGWDSRVNDAAAYLNVGMDGKMHFPGFGMEATAWLLANRGVACIGVDTASLDRGEALELPVHRAWCAADKHGLENVANLAALPPRGTTIVIGVVPWEEGSGGPCRLIALL